MTAQTLKPSDKVECLGVVGHEYLEFEAFRGAIGTVIKQGSDSGMWLVKFDEPQFALDKEGNDNGPYLTFERMEEELEKVGETDVSQRNLAQTSAKSQRP